MRILVLGAGALGGYFGARLIEAGAEVAFLVRPARASLLADQGLRIDSPFGAFHRPVTTLTAATPGWDVILLACKAYDLEAAMAAIRPAVGADTAILPVLNGLAHIETLTEIVGAPHVLGGLAKIQATLTPEGAIRHLNDWRYITFGELDGTLSPRVLALRDAFAAAPGVVAEAVPDVMARLWEKLTHLGTSAMATVLMRANVGEIARSPGGVALMARILERNIAIAAHHGHPVRPGFLAEYTQVFSDPASQYAASMLRDIEGGNRIEADHILGFLFDAARRAGVPDELHEAAFIHAKAYEQRRAAGR
ncbi:ketopantoate reductase family protein [Plastoroseomonas arctica]|uniref:2-dehydropantoate 2-reductase n=1 Tax=Plastoroseomonas arctica TaxID=1509237 RepID=A0AAF1KLX0_9PROT|nr:ketopantoate reductase family protein [Plastoroseomonas arctica]MBR0655316.1 ketopantoate reductase family protein [Plastoroseomonas arctica]